MNSLARSLNQQGRYTDGRSVGNCAAEFFKDIIRIKTPSCSAYFHEKARALRFEGYLCESEELLRAILCHAPDRKNKNTMLVMLELADTLTRSGREAEAITLKKQAFCMRLEMFGVEDRGSEWHCWELGFCYARLGRYEDAIAIFNETIEKVALETLTDYEYRDRFINQLKHWISKVEAMKKEAQNAGQ
jgi:tetratricopeptide (TPR) repeat protein